MFFCVMTVSTIFHWTFLKKLDTSQGRMARKSKILTALIILLTLLLTSCHGVGTSSQRYDGGGGLGEEEETLDPSTMPYFDYSVPRNISNVVGQHAFLLCRVYRIEGRSVSWIRKRDLHILSAGLFSYTSDQRFVVLHQEKSENWTLQIKYTQERDNGIYECQVNTEPKISMAFHLTVIQSRARIIGGSDVHVKSGSSLRLTCEVEHGPHDIAQVFWYHGPTIIDTQGLMGDQVASDIRVVTQRGDLLRSQLTIPKVALSNSGNYTCSPTMAVPASVFVHVLNGEEPAAMQHGNRSSSCRSHVRSLEYCLVLVVLQLISLTVHSSFLTSLSSICLWREEGSSECGESVGPSTVNVVTVISLLLLAQTT